MLSAVFLLAITISGCAQPKDEQYFPFFENGKWGYLDNKGVRVIEPKFDGGGDFYEGRAMIIENGHGGYINTKGEVVIKTEYDGVNHFFEGLASVMQNDKWGFIDKEGNMAIVPRFAIAQ